MDYIGFCDLNGDKQPEILIGGEDANRDKKLIVYKWDRERYRKLIEIDYVGFAIGDLEGNGTSEIASIVRTNKQIPTVKLQVYSFTDNSYKQECEMEFQYGDYPDNVIIGNINENRKGIFVDLGLGAHSAITEIVVKEDGRYKIDYLLNLNYNLMNI